MTRPEVAHMLRAFADEFEADSPGEATRAALRWIAEVAGIDGDGQVHAACNVLCWGDDPKESP